ncbi:MAG: transposase, partial [Nitrospirae bacterium]|nr:transposase [Nitrospirota bacterium]
MGLMMKEKKSVVKETASRYQKAKKKLKGIILNEIVALTGYVRCYASYILRNHGRKAS